MTQKLACRFALHQGRLVESVHFNAAVFNNVDSYMNICGVIFLSTFSSVSGLHNYRNQLVKSAIRSVEHCS